VTDMIPDPTASLPPEPSGDAPEQPDPVGDHGWGTDDPDAVEETAADPERDATRDDPR
jgi:hypothetical protein